MTKGTLRVTVVEAKKLHDEDWIGKGDPYVKLVLDKFNSQATKPISGTNDPKYNETFTFNVDGQKKLDIEIWDKDVAKDDLIGQNDVDLSPAFSSGHHEGWYKIKKHTIGFSKGEVHLSMDFTSE